ncbi:MAG: phosphate uptake regulator PhoU [Desulfurococcales archaeon]
MNKRKLQEIGGTYIVSLPKDWIRFHNLTKQDEVIIETLPDLSLKITPMLKGRVISSNTVVHLKGIEKYDLTNIISKYLMGFEEILIKCETREASYVDTITKAVLKRTMGLEVFEMDYDTILLKNISGDLNIGIEDIIQRLFRTLKSILNDLNEAILNGGNAAQKLSEIVEKEDVVDKITLYGLKILNKIMLGQYMPGELGFNSLVEVNLSYNILKNFERAADHITYVAKKLKDFELNLNEDERAHISRHLNLLMGFTEGVQHLYMNGSIEVLIELLISRYEEIKKAEEEYIKYLSKNHLIYPIVDSLWRVRTYLHDMIEIYVDRATLADFKNSIEKISSATVKES